MKFLLFVVAAVALTVSSSSANAEAGSGSVAEQVLRKISNNPEDFLYQSTGQHAECCLFGIAALRIEENTKKRATIALVGVFVNHESGNSTMWIKMFPNLTRILEKEVLLEALEAISPTFEESLDSLSMSVIAENILPLPPSVKEQIVTDRGGDGTADLFIESFLYEEEKYQRTRTPYMLSAEKREEVEKYYRAVINALGL